MSESRRFKLLTLVHNHGLEPTQVVGRVREYERFLDEEAASPAQVAPPAGGAKGGKRGAKKGGHPFD